jgi:hypothetical protein
MEFVENGVQLGARAAGIADSLTRTLPSSAERHYFDHESGRFVLSADKQAAADRPQAVSGPQRFAGRFGPVNLREAVDAFTAARSSRPPQSPAVFILLSDFQRGTVEVFDSLRSILADSGGKAICVSLAPHTPRNYSVTAVNGASLNGGVSVVVRALGAAMDSTYVELTVGDLRIGQRSVACAANDSVTVMFDLPPAKIGAFGKVELHASDPLPFDNIDYFTVSEETGRTALIVGSVQRNKVIGAALRAAGPSFWNQVVLKEGPDLSYEDINAADLVIVNSFNGRSRVLESFIVGGAIGKGVIVALDPERGDDFGRSVFRGITSNQKVFPSVQVAEKGLSPMLVDTNSTLWRGFPAMSSKNSKIYRFMSPIFEHKLVMLSMNHHALVTSNIHAGSNILIIATPIGVTQSNNLCETGFFVPFVDRLGRYALLAGRGQADEARYAGYAVRNPFFGGGRTGTLYDRDGKVAAAWSNQPYVRVDKPGVYTLVSSSGETANFAVSPHPLESEMDFERPELGNSGGIYYFEAGQFLEQIGNLSNNAWSYWIWVVLGLMLCLEVFLWKSLKSKSLKSKSFKFFFQTKPTAS